MPAEVVLGRVQSSRENGLGAGEAARRRADCGPNALPAPGRRGPLSRFLAQFRNVLIYVLLGAALVTAALGHWVDSGVIAGVVIINALIGFLQEGKAERALDAIARLLPHNAHVLRDGQRRQLPAQELVPGDIVLLEAGDKVPADLRLLDTHGLTVEEAAITGESMPADKISTPVPEDTELGDRACMAYSGTLVRHGQAVGAVVATGAATEIGRISGMLAGERALDTPLLRQLAAFGRRLTWATLLLAAFAFLFGTMVRDYARSDMFLAAVGVAVALIPEGLPAIITITLAIGVQRMAKRHAIIRRLPAVETLGSVTVICTDKTGTLTRNEMSVRRVMTAHGVFDVSGTGYAPHGEFFVAGRKVDPSQYEVLREAGLAALLCNDAAVSLSGDEWQVAGDPTEGALVTFAMKTGLDPREEHLSLPRIGVVPFESERRFMATLHGGRDAVRHLFIKGAPERILPLCHWQRHGGGERPLELAAWQRHMAEAATAGLRLLAVARRHTGAEALDVETATGAGYTLLAVLGLSDPPREEAISAVARCRAAGVRVKMVTGDHATTAVAIGNQLGLQAAAQACSGADMARMAAGELADCAAATDIFARVSPEDKLRLVQALQSRGEVVAMTGDGVNDAPALQQADVGVAMGHKGTETAKEAAEMVLADDNFASVTAAIEEGRAVYDNIRKALVFILPTNGGEAGMLMVAIILGVTMPITPVQILWVNMITAVTLALAIAFEPPEDDVMARPPRNPREPLLTGFLTWRIALVTFLMVAGGIGLFLYELAHGASLAVARTASVNTIVMSEVAYLFNVRRFRTSSLGLAGFTGNRYVVLAVGLLLVFQLLFTYLGPMQALFGTAALGLAGWARVMLLPATIFFIVELEKQFLLGSYRARGRRRRTSPG